jgi:AcrR family transcriptional regulator
MPRSPDPTAAGDGSPQTRDRLLTAAAALLDESGGRPVSTRAVCERAGVQAPSLYHHFGSKERLFDEVVSHGFKRFLAARRGKPARDPIDDVRRGWDAHVAFGLEYPAFYALIYGSVRPGVPCAVVADVEAMVLDALRPAARAGRLRVSPEEAAAHIVAASSGVTLALIQQPPDAVDLGLSARVRDAALAAIAFDEPTADDRPGPSGATAAEAAIALTAALEDDIAGESLSPGESTLLRELLDRLRTGAGGAGGAR